MRKEHIDMFFRKCVLNIIKLFNTFFPKNNDLPRQLFEKRRHFLVINNQGYGDILVMTPFIRAIKSVFYDSVLSIVTSQSGYEVLQHSGYVDNLFVYKDGIKNYVYTVKKLREMSFDATFDMAVSLSSLQRLLFPLLIGTKFRINFSRGGFRGLLPHYEIEYTPQHLVDGYLSIIEPFTKRKFSRLPEIFISKSDKEFSVNIIKKFKIKGKFIIFHAYAENPNHLWPVNNWAQLADKLCEYDSVIFTVPENGRQYVNLISQKMQKSIETIMPASFNQLASLINACDLLITIDTCTVHIASAVNTKSVIIYGPTIPKFWGPLNKNQIVLQKDTVCHGKCRDYDMNTIFGNVELCQKLGDNCINYITVDEVLKTVDKLL